MKRERVLRCTVHWYENGAERQHDIQVNDYPIGELVPMLIEALAIQNQQDAPISTLHLRPSPQLSAWPREQTLIDVGVRTGDHIWLTATLPNNESDSITVPAPRPSRSVLCTLLLPGSVQVPVNPGGQDITRSWLLNQLRSNQWVVEQLRFYIGRSLYQFVSNSAPHCRLQPNKAGEWFVSTNRTDITTILNGVPLIPGRPTPIQSADVLQLGTAGLSLTIRLE